MSEKKELVEKARRLGMHAILQAMQCSDLTNTAHSASVACINALREMQLGFIRFLNRFPNTLSHHGWIREMFELRGITGFERYQKVADLLQRDACHRTLDVGSGRTSPLKHAGFEVVSIDIRREMGPDIIADISHLPFQSKVFDCVTAIDVLEHIGPSRESAISEIKRCGKIVIAHSPLQDNENYLGRVGDLMLLKYVEDMLGRIDKNTLDHIRCGEPSPEEFKRHGFLIVQPDWNINVWLVLMKSHYLFYSFVAPVLVILYLLVLRRIRNPPYWGGYLVWRQVER